MKTFFTRLTSSTPKFFKKLQLFGLSLIALAYALTKVEDIPADLADLAKTAKWIGGTVVAVAQFAQTNCAAEDKKDEPTTA